MANRRPFRTESDLFHVDTCEPLKQAVANGALALEAVGRGNYPGRSLAGAGIDELCMAGYWNAEHDQRWGLDWHCNEGIEIGYVAAGSLPFAVGSRTMVVKPGELTITRPWQRHRVGDPSVSASHYSWVILDVGVRRPNQRWRWPEWLLYAPQRLMRLTEMLSHNEQPVWHADRRIAQCFARLDEVVGQSGEDDGWVRLKLVINELMVLLTEMLESRNPSLEQSLSGSDYTVRLFLESLVRRLDEPWTLDAMAEECGLGRTRFASICRRIVNLTPMQHLQQLRLEAGDALLKQQPRMAVTEIAFRCGFESSQYFARAYRTRYGCSPSEARATDRGFAGG